MGEVDVEKIAEAVLYEGYLLFPYRRSAMKNQQRWTFGGVYPRQYSEATGGDDPYRMQTQCLVSGNAATMLEIKVRFLHVVERKVLEKTAEGLRFVEELRVGGQRHQPWEEAMERSISLGAAHEEPSLRLSDFLTEAHSFAIDIPAGSEDEALRDPAGEVVGALRREWRSLKGAVEIIAEPLNRFDKSVSVPPSRASAGDPPLMGGRGDGNHLPLSVSPSDSPINGGRGAGNTAQDETQIPGESVYRLTVRIVNTTPWLEAGREEASRNDAVRQAFISTHTILRVQDGAFISLLEPPDVYKQAAGECENIKTWPVLVGETGERHTLLSSPIILYDYPQISPESQGNYFDATEIDELLALSVMTLTDEEKQEMRESDVRGREILERTEALSEEQLLKLHGVVRYLRPTGRNAE